MAKCPAITRSGAACKGVVKPGDTYCVAHDPDRAGQRKRSASKAGRSKPSRELVDIRTQLQTLADGVLAGSVHRGDAAVAGQLLNVKLRGVELERRLRETEDLEKRLEELESALQSGGPGGGYGPQKTA